MFFSIFTKQLTFVTSYLLSCTPSPFLKWSSFNRSKSFPFTVDHLQKGGKTAETVLPHPAPPKAYQFPLN